MAEQDFITRCRDNAKLLDELAKNHERIAEVWAESKHAAFAAACMAGAQTLRGDADAAEEDARDEDAEAEVFHEDEGSHIP